MASLFQPSLIPSSRTPDQMSSFAFCQLLKSSWPASLPTRPSGLPGFLHALPGLFNLGLSYQIVLILSPWGFHILSVPKAAILVQAFNACHRDYCCSFLTAAPNNPSHHCATSLQESSPKLGTSCSPSVWETSAVQGHPQLLSEFKASLCYVKAHLKKQNPHFLCLGFRALCTFTAQTSPVAPFSAVLCHQSQETLNFLLKPLHCLSAWRASPCLLGRIPTHQC